MPLHHRETWIAKRRERARPPLRAAWTLLVATLVTSALSSCGTINEKIAAGAGDYVPAWAGGLPANAPPRPGTPEYEAWTKENERRRAMPATERQQLEKSESQAAAPQR